MTDKQAAVGTNDFMTAYKAFIFDLPLAGIRWGVGSGRRKEGNRSQREIEKAVREAVTAGTVAGTERLKARMKLEVEGANLELVIEDDIALS